MSSKRAQLPLARVTEEQRRLLQQSARKHQYSAASSARRMAGHGARSQKGR